jgi:hypothetical protein
LLIAVPALSTSREEYDPNAPTTIQNYDGNYWHGPPPVLFENGPLSNSAGTGVGGADESVLLNVSIGMTTLGLGHQADPSIDNRIADDFTVPAGETWDIGTITTFAYQTGAPASGTMTGVSLEIWDGVPGISNLVFGDIDGNYMSSTGFANVYRVTEESTGGSTDRAIQASESTVDGLSLGAGTYYMAWQTDGSASFSGPWAPPIAETDGDAVTGNGLQSLAGGPYDPALDGGTTTQQGFPFIISGETPSTPVEVVSWGNLKSTFSE